MINGISSALPVQPATTQAPAQASKPAVSQSAGPTDSVQLSAAAQKARSGASGDVDHDGDSH